MKDNQKEWSNQFIIGFEDVKFQEYRGSSFIFHRMDMFMGGKHNIKNILTRNKTFLARIKDSMKERFNSIDQNFREDLIISVIKSNGLEVKHSSTLFHFRNYNYEGLVKLI